MDNLEDLKYEGLKNFIVNRYRFSVAILKKKFFPPERTCDIEGCERPGRYLYGPIGMMEKGTGEMKKVGETEGINVVKWTGRKKFHLIVECEQH